MTKNAVTATAILVATLAAPALAQMPPGNATAGEKVFTQCKTCHVTTAGVNRIGPSLHDVVGRKAGIVPKFAYSVANKSSGIVWTEAKLFQYLEAPRKVVPGTKMAFAGLKKPQDRADVIAYLKTQKG
jgi:cytochrome c